MYTSGSARALYALLFLIVTGQSNAQSLAASDVTETTPLSAAPGLGSTSAPALAAATGAPEYIYEVGRDYNLTCILPAVDVKTIVWFKNNTQVQSKERVVIEGAVLRYNGKWQEEDYGEYACSAGGVNQTFYVRAKVHPKLPANSNVVEGQNLRLTCKLLGKPYPMVHWLFSNETVTNMSVIELLGQRAVYNDTIRAAENELLLKEVQRWDAGNYTCYVTEPFAMNSTTIVRVKDKYAALWPFLGICIEVFVLCAIILVYEKRRTKPELDDSDTDNHDQKKS